MEVFIVLFFLVICVGILYLTVQLSKLQNTVDETFEMVQTVCASMRVKR